MAAGTLDRVANHLTSDDRVHGISENKLLDSGNIFLDIFVNTCQNCMKFEANTPQKYMKSKYVMHLLLKCLLLKIEPSKQFFLRDWVHTQNKQYMKNDDI